MKQFQAESKRLLDLMVHSIYTNPDIFLRELVSNANDAIDKMYVKSLSDSSIEFNRDSFYIEIKRDESARTLTIRDTGIGMTAEEMEENLGTIAHSGSLAFKKANEKEEQMNIIGQFGVGFYSAFMVADSVEVISKAYGNDQAYHWKSEGTEGYTIEKTEKETVGTDVILHLKEDGEERNYSEYLQEYHIRELIRRYSNYVRYPIRMEVTKTERIEPKDENEEPTYETKTEIETLNSMTPLWEKSKSSLTEEDYKQFYYQERFGFDEPLHWIHMVADGTLSYRAVLYIPGQVPFNFYTKEYKKGLALYSGGVRIMDSCEELLPDYFSFVKGVVSSEDLSLNISRELLQQDRRLLTIAKRIENKISEELKSMLTDKREQYEKFFEQFGSQLKAGIYQSYGANKEKLEDLLLFHTSARRGLVSLSEYLEKQTNSVNQNEENSEEKTPIYYASGDSVDAIDHLPALQSLKANNIEVLYLTEDIDEFMIRMMKDYQGHEFVSVLSEDFNLPHEKDSTEQENGISEETEKMRNDVFEKMKEVLDGEVVRVRASKRLVDDAVVLVSTGDISIDMEKTFMNQPGMHDVVAQKVLEVNPNHSVFEKLMALKDQNESLFKDYTFLLYDQARLIEGLPVKDAVQFAKRVQNLMI